VCPDAKVVDVQHGAQMTQNYGTIKGPGGDGKQPEEANDCDEYTGVQGLAWVSVCSTNGLQQKFQIVQIIVRAANCGAKISYFVDRKKGRNDKTSKPYRLLHLWNPGD
jgi:hypothetical protein